MMNRILTVAIVLPAALWVSMQLDNFRRFSASPSNWLEVTSIHVDDATHGETHRMQVVRSIHQPFYGEWIATIRNVSDGTLANTCLAEGKADYSPAANELTMDWWTFPTKCRPPPGVYRLDMHWRIFPPGYPQKDVRAFSNVFSVAERK